MRFDNGKMVHSCLLAAVLLACTGAAFGAPITVVDQENPGPFKWTNSAWAGMSYGQSFTPTLAGIDAFESLFAGDGATVVIRLRDGVAGTDGLQGAIFAESFPTAVNGSTAMFHFDFASTVALIPGRTYVAEAYIVAGIVYSRYTEGDAYAGGQYFCSGMYAPMFSDYDMVYREGLHGELTPAAVPAPAALALVGLGLPAVLGLRRRRKP
jgi:hypothetical protein